MIPITRPPETVALGMVYRPFSVEFQKEPEASEEEIKTDYKGNEPKETYINRPMIETSGDSIAEYYRKNMRSLLTFDIYGVMLVKPDGTIGCGGRVIYSNVVAGWRDMVAVRGVKE